MSTFGKELIESATEALAIALGKIATAKVISPRLLDAAKARSTG
jgi:hypothetical protein